MGERNPSVAAPPAPPPWPQRAVLAAALLVAVVVVLIGGPADPSPGAATPALLVRALELPLKALSETHGATLLGALLLFLAAGLGCRSLEQRIGAQGPLLVVFLLFGSATWALLWEDGVSLAPLALGVTAFALAYAGGGAYEQPTEIFRPLEAAGAGALRWSVVGLLLAELVPSGPLLAGLMVPAALAVPRERRRRYLPLLLAGFAVGLAAELVVHGPALLRDPVALAAGSASFDPILIGQNLLSLVAGRNVGLLAGFAPLPLLLVLARGSVARPGLAVTGLALPVLGVLLLPWDWASGWIQLSFIGIYGALWHLPSRPLRRREWILGMVMCGLVTWPLFVAPRQTLAHGGVELGASAPRRLLPYEATLRRLPNRGEGYLAGRGIWARAVAGCRLVGESGRFELDGKGSALIWVAVPEEVEMVALELGPGAPSAVELAGAVAGRTVFRPDGRVGFEVLLDKPRGKHRLWLDERPMAVHLLEVGFPGRQDDAALRFRLLAAPQP